MTQPRLTYDREMQEARRYWCARLSSISFDPFIPLDHPRPPDDERAPEALTFTLDPDLYADLRQLTSRNASLLFAVLILGLRLCGDRYGGTREATIFCPTTGETGTDLVPIVEALPGDLAVRDALLATRALLSTAYRHQRYGLSHLGRHLPDNSRNGRLPLVAAMAGLQKGIPDLKWDVALLFEAGEASCAVTIHFDRRIYEQSTIRGFFETFSVMLREAVADMRRPIGELRADGGRASSRRGSTEVGDVNGAADARLHRAIEAIARNAPRRLALVDRHGAMSFGALLEATDRLSETLAGLKRDERGPVAILVGEGLEAIVGMLAVSKAGRAFVLVKPAFLRRPLDEALAALGCTCLLCGPGQFENEEGYDILARTTDRIVLTRSAAEGAAAPRVEATIVPASASDERPARAFDLAAETACVLIDDRAGELTVSPIGHAEILHLFRWLNDSRSIGPGDRSLLLPGLGACEQLYSTLGLLMAGGTVEISTASGLDQTEAIAEQLSAPGISVWILTAPLLQNLLPALSVSLMGKGSGPRRILVSGEVQSAPFGAKLSRQFATAEVTGLWASAALGLWSLHFPFVEHDSDLSGYAIAREIPGFDHIVLNGANDRVPINVAGELHVRRDGETDADWRATGLRARPLGNGLYHWLRGWDHVVLKNDCRVELTRLETALGRIDPIRMAEVVADGEGDRGCRILAFVAGPADALEIEDALDRLAGSGEVDLVPDRTIAIECLPLGPDGGVDLAGLLAANNDPGPEPRADARSEEIRARLRPHWLRALQQEEVDDDDSFFGSGGNSLKATLLITRIKEEFGVELSVQDFFRRPTIRAIVQLIRAGQGSETGPGAIPDIKPVPRARSRVLLSDLERPAHTA